MLGFALEQWARRRLAKRRVGGYWRRGELLFSLSAEACAGALEVGALLVGGA